MGKACSIHRRNENHTKFGSENLKGRHHLEDLGTDWRVLGRCGLDVSGFRFCKRWGIS
jgi:hypothetical protein